MDLLRDEREDLVDITRDKKMGVASKKNRDNETCREGAGGRF